MRFGFTLIEMLSVVIVISIIAAMGAVGLAAGNEQAQMRATISALKNLDAEARMRARSNGPVRLVVSNDPPQVFLHSGGDSTNFVQIPRDIEVELKILGRTHAGLNDSTVHFDALGRSPDYEFTLTLHTQVRTWSVAGLTGWISDGNLRIGAGGGGAL